MDSIPDPQVIPSYTTSAWRSHLGQGWLTDWLYRGALDLAMTQSKTMPGKGKITNWPLLLGSLQTEFNKANLPNGRSILVVKVPYYARNWRGSRCCYRCQSYRQFGRQVWTCAEHQLAQIPVNPQGRTTGQYSIHSHPSGSERPNWIHRSSLIQSHRRDLQDNRQTFLKCTLKGT